uniref:receptor-like protein EIX2 n=1 Tax=Erigeron canadensis TaxID=72917 RepID=UPI001CB9488A|nr:receptor-like protein EIX2 [Erigeron canadensis]
MRARFPISYFSSCYLCWLIFLVLFHLCLSDQKHDDHVLCLDSERDALMQFKHDLIDEANLIASWVGGKSDCCRWAGIVCDNITGHVHEIHLPGNDGQCEADWTTYEEIKERFKHKLGGHLNPSLLELKQLKHLDLSCNNFKKIQIPSFIGSLRNLRYLNLSYSNFGGMFPPQIGNISELRVLSLSDLDEISIMEMKWLSNLRRLHHLDMSLIDLSKATDWFQVINTLPSLVELHLSICELSNWHPHVSRLNVTSLTVLDLFGNDFGKTFPRWIFNLTNLVSLHLGDCRFNNPLPSGIYSFRNLASLQTFYAYGNHFMNSSSLLKGLSSNLKVLDISYCGISSSVLHSLDNSTSLLSLDMSGNQLTEAIPSSLGNLCELKEIDLSFNTFGNISLAYLLKSLLNCKSPSLESLDIFGSRLSGPIPKSIIRISSLKTLVLANNRLNGSIPNLIGQLSSLEVLDLESNQLSGNLPVSLGQLSKLIDLSFSNNSLVGSVTEAHFAKLVSLKSLDGSGNNLTLKLQVANWYPPFHVQALFLNSWCLGPQFPTWLQSQRDLTWLDISSANISSPMPRESFWRSFPNLTHLDMSHNHIKGTLTLGILGTVDVLDLSFNEFSGKLSTVSNDSLLPVSLYLSNNFFEGSLRQLLCLNGVQETHVLSLGYNYFSGVLPDCWEKWPNLQVLTLGNNKLSGEIPRTLGSVQGLQLLNIHENKISGRLPNSLMKLTSLNILQLGKNELTGSIPSWIGTKLSLLKILNLRSNHLEGNLPHELCYLSQTQILDLAQNNLSGNIPRCLYNFSVLSGKETNSLPDLSFSFEGYDISDGGLASATASDTLVMKGQEYTYSSILGLVTLLDLSSNNFSGQIPSELTTLGELKSLNLSRNELTGRIPGEIGDMKALESLDLSMNMLYGELPISLSRLNFLSYFNVSYNNLTGSVPVSTQLQSFNESSFYGNKLCGTPLSDHCVLVEVPTQTTGYEKKERGFGWGLIISIVLGFVTGFWISVVPLIVSTSWRVKYFSLMGKLINVYGS